MGVTETEEERDIKEKRWRGTLHEVTLITIDEREGLKHALETLG